MALFDRWNIKTKSKGEPVNLHHKDVEKVVEIIFSSPKGRRHGARCHLHDGTVVDVLCPAGETQDRLNDDIAEAPEMPEIVTKAVEDVDEPEDYDDDDD